MKLRATRANVKNTLLNALILSTTIHRLYCFLQKIHQIVNALKNLFIYTKRLPQFCLLCSPAKSAQKAMERRKKVEKKTPALYNRIYTNRRRPE